MSQFDDLPPPRRPLFFPVVIATVLLSVIGMSAGLALGSRHEAPPQYADQAGDQNPGIPATPGDSPVECPPQMHATARKVGFDLPMTQVLRVRVDQTGLTVWVCQDRTGRLFYQANQGGEGERWVEGETALFLSDVVARDDGYLATAADGNTFDVNTERLKVVVKGKERTSAVTPE